MVSLLRNWGRDTRRDVCHWGTLRLKAHSSYLARGRGPQGTPEISKVFAWWIASRQSDLWTPSLEYSLELFDKLNYTIFDLPRVISLYTSKMYQHMGILSQSKAMNGKLCSFKHPTLEPCIKWLACIFFSLSLDSLLCLGRLIQVNHISSLMSPPLASHSHMVGPQGKADYLAQDAQDNWAGWTISAPIKID